jgi:hypothetical protein
MKEEAKGVALAEPEIIQSHVDILMVGGGMGNCGVAYEAVRWADKFAPDLKMMMLDKAAVDRSGAVAQGLSARPRPQATRPSTTISSTMRRYQRSWTCRPWLRNWAPTFWTRTATPRHLMVAPRRHLGRSQLSPLRCPPSSRVRPTATTSITTTISRLHYHSYIHTSSSSSSSSSKALPSRRLLLAS